MKNKLRWNPQSLEAVWAYNVNGNLTAMPLLTLSYDVENRLVEATHSSRGTDRYVYDS